MFHVIAVFFQQVKPFVFNLPARPTSCCNVGYIGFGDIKRGDEAKALRWLTVSDPANLKFNIINLQRIIAVSDRQLLGNSDTDKSNSACLRAGVFLTTRVVGQVTPSR